MASARSVNLRINPFPLVGATTRFSMVSVHSGDRFGSVWALEYYDVEDMNLIAPSFSGILNADYEAGA